MADLEPRPSEDLIDRWRVQPRTQWAEIVGHERQIRRLRELATKIALSAEERTRLGIRLGAGIVVTGPSDCGKTQLARAFAAELGSWHPSFPHAIPVWYRLRRTLRGP